MDRFLIYDGFLGFFPHLSGMVLQKHLLDHRHILLLEHRVDYGPVHFRGFYSWFDLEGFDEVVRSSWSQDQGTPGVYHPWVKFKNKLQLLKSNLHIWNTARRVRLGSKLWSSNKS